MARSFNIGLTTEDIQYFEKKVWKQLRTYSLADQLAANDGSSVVHRVTDLKNTTWGYEAILTLVPDDTSYGVVGDNRLKDNEAGLTSHDLPMTFDQFRKGFKTEGVMADRSSWVRFAEQASDQLSYWAVDIKNRLMMNVLSGIDFGTELDGTARSSQFPTCRFAAHVSAPSANRHVRWDGGAAGSLATGDTTAVESTDLPTWNTFLDMRGELPMMRVKPVRGTWGNGQDLYIALVHPRTMTHLKKDEDFQKNWREAMARGEGNPLFKGAEAFLVDGILVISHRYVFSTIKATSGSRWGLNGTIHGTRSLFLGAQALGMVELDGPKWTPGSDDYENIHSIAMAIKFGMRKSVWPDQYADNSEEDFGVVALDHALPSSGLNSYGL
jgi:N4-gp56 family major capsid protein